MTKECKYFTKKLENGNRIPDFKKLVKVNGNLIPILTPRGWGKTFNAKEHARDEWEEKRIKSIWLMNTNVQCEQDASKFLSNNRKVNPHNWEGYEVKGVIDNGTLGVYDPNGEMFIQFVALSTAEKFKGSRDTTYQRVYYDEFNVGLQMIRHRQVILLDSLINTLADTQTNNEGLKIFIFGNNKSINTPLFVGLQIFEIKDEIMTVYNENNYPIAFVFTPKIDIEEIEEKNKDNWVFQLGKHINTSNSNFLNESMFDRMNGIKEIPLNELNSKWKLAGVYEFEEENYTIHQQPNSKNYHFRIVRKNEEIPKGIQIQVAKKNDMEVGYNLNEDFKDIIMNQLIDNNITFDNITSKHSCLEMIGAIRRSI